MKNKWTICVLFSSLYFINSINSSKPRGSKGGGGKLKKLIQNNQSSRSNQLKNNNDKKKILPPQNIDDTSNDFQTLNPTQMQDNTSYNNDSDVISPQQEKQTLDVIAAEIQQKAEEQGKSISDTDAQKGAEYVLEILEQNNTQNNINILPQDNSLESDNTSENQNNYQPSNTIKDKVEKIKNDLYQKYGQENVELALRGAAGIIITSGVTSGVLGLGYKLKKYFKNKADLEKQKKLEEEKEKRQKTKLEKLDALFKKKQSIHTKAAFQELKKNNEEKERKNQDAVAINTQTNDWNLNEQSQNQEDYHQEFDQNENDKDYVVQLNNIFQKSNIDSIQYENNEKLNSLIQEIIENFKKNGRTQNLKDLATYLSTNDLVIKDDFKKYIANKIRNVFLPNNQDNQEENYENQEQNQNQTMTKKELQQMIDGLNVNSYQSFFDALNEIHKSNISDHQDLKEALNNKKNEMNEKLKNHKHIEQLKGTTIPNNYEELLKHI